MTRSPGWPTAIAALAIAGLALAAGLALVLASRPAIARPAAAPPAPDGGDRGDGDRDADGAAFAAATRKLAEGDLAGARADLEALATAAPGGRWADDALAEAATVAERLGDLAGARALWSRLLDRYPDSRLARRASARMAALIEAGGPGGAWDEVAAAHDRLVRAAAGRGDPRPMLRELAALLDQHPGYPRGHAAAMWLADSWARMGDVGAARRWYARARAAAGDDLERFRTDMAEASLLASAGEFDLAEQLYDALRPPDAASAREVRERRDQLETDRLLHRLVIVAWLVLAALAVLGVVALRWRSASWAGAARALWPPPLEVIYLVPIALVFAFVAETGNQLAAHATETILVGALVITWLSGAGLAAAARCGRPARPVVLGHAAAAALAVLALVYVVIMREGLLDLLIETWRRGHELQ